MIPILKACLALVNVVDWLKGVRCLACHAMLKLIVVKKDGHISVECRSCWEMENNAD